MISSEMESVLVGFCVDENPLADALFTEVLITSLFTVVLSYESPVPRKYLYILLVLLVAINNS